MMRTIRKAKLKEDDHLIVDYVEIIDLEDGTQLERDNTVAIKKQLHPDLINAFKLMRIHFGLIAEFIDLDDVSKDMFNDLDGEAAHLHPGVKQLVCNQVIITNEFTDDYGIQLGGRKILRQNKPLNCLTPLVKLHQENSYYPFKVDLNNDLKRVIEEVEECLDGKFMELGQEEMFKEELEMNPES